MPLTLDALTTLGTVERRGSLVRAAEELARAPTSQTCAVQQVEAGLDVLLFDGSGHRACFTPAGRVLLENGRAPLAAVNALAWPSATAGRALELGARALSHPGGLAEVLNAD